MEEVKPCPFCGKPPDVYHSIWGYNPKVWYVECINTKCDVEAITVSKSTKKRAIEAWNRRI